MMPDEPAATGPTPAVAGPDSVPVFEIEEVTTARRKWVLSLLPGHVALRAASEAQPYVYLREDFYRKLELFPALGLLNTQEPLKLGFKLGPEAARALRQWLGAPNREQLALLLKRRYTLALPIAFLFLIASLPLSGANGQATPFSPLNLALGLSLVALWGWSKYRPHPVLFLLDGLWFLALALGQFRLVYRSGDWWWLIWTALLLWMAYGGLKRYRQCRGG